MDFRTHWEFDNFFPEAAQMRLLLENEFNDKIGNKKPFNQRGIWNYWYIENLYTYLRASPENIFPEMVPGFMKHLRDFIAWEFGLVTLHIPTISMYINGCGQNIHNDAYNGRLAYVFSLTKWAERHFEGGETLVYKTGSSLFDHSFQPHAGPGFYNKIDPVFNRLAIFDDRMPHAVRFIQGTMKPLDARFVMHGHMVDPEEVPFVYGALHGTDLSATWKPLQEAVSSIFRSFSYDGFVTFRVVVDASGRVSDVGIKYMQLMPYTKEAKDLDICLEEAKKQVAASVWPQGSAGTEMVFAIGSGSVKRNVA